MLLLIAAVGVTLTGQHPLRRDAMFWEASPSRQRLAQGVALISLVLWVSILFAGRWIAYVQPR
jgi:hypothetical protein